MAAIGGGIFRPKMVRFCDEGHLGYYGKKRMVVSCGGKKEKKEKKREKLVKVLSKDLMEFESMRFGVEGKEGMVGEINGKTMMEATEILLSQLNRMRAEAKEMKKKRKQEKAAMKAAKMKDKTDDSSSSSSSESSDSECEAVVKMNRFRTPFKLPESKSDSHPYPIGMLQVEETNMALKLDQECSSSTNGSTCCSSSSNSTVVAGNSVDKIEVCMGGKCKKSGAMELLQEFEKKVGIEGAVVGCKCMGKCKEGPNVRVVNQRTEEEGFVKVSKNPLCIGVGLEDVGNIVANFFGEKKDDVGLFAT